MTRKLTLLLIMLLLFAATISTAMSNAAAMPV
jgi:hypothetical protein